MTEPPWLGEHRREREPLWWELPETWCMFILAIVLAAWFMSLNGCAHAGPYIDKGCAAIHEADLACQWLTIVRADGTRVRVPKSEGIAAMRRAGLEQPAP